MRILTMIVAAVTTVMVGWLAVIAVVLSSVTVSFVAGAVIGAVVALMVHRPLTCVSYRARQKPPLPLAPLDIHAGPVTPPPYRWGAQNPAWSRLR